MCSCAFAKDCSLLARISQQFVGVGLVNRYVVAIDVVAVNILLFTPA